MEEEVLLVYDTLVNGICWERRRCRSFCCCRGEKSGIDEWCWRRTRLGENLKMKVIEKRPIKNLIRTNF